MLFSELRPGALYVVRGEGVMQYAGGGNANSVPLLAHGYGKLWARPEDVLRTADWRDVDAYQEQAKPRGVECKDAECWCRRRDGLVFSEHEHRFVVGPPMYQTRGTSLR